MAQRLQERRGANRHEVSWPVRVWSIEKSAWHTGKVLNLSVTGVLLQLEYPHHVGEQVEVEIDFLPQPDSATIIAGVGRIVREHKDVPGGAAVAFVMECELTRMEDRLGYPATTAPGVRDARRGTISPQARYTRQAARS